MSSKLAIRVAPASALALLALIATATSAHATYPGNNNGRLAFGITVDGNANPDVYSVLPNGRALRQLTDDPGFDACAAYSTDGELIAWCGPGGVWLMNQDGTDKRQLTTFGNFPDISPDGSKIVFNGAPPGSANVDIWTVDIATGDLTRLTTVDGLDQFGAWSPDGSKIVFESTRTGVKQVWLMNADGSNQTQLTLDATPKDQVPDWSPDGSHIAYVARTAAVGGDIWEINADGTDPHPITSGLDLLGTAWSPDGTQIATLEWTTRCEAGAPEFEQVVGGCDQLPFGLAGGEAAPEEVVWGAQTRPRIEPGRFAGRSNKCTPRPQRLPIRAPRLQLEHLTLLDHLGTSSIDNEIEESHPHCDDDHPSQREGVEQAPVAVSSTGRDRNSPMGSLPGCLECHCAKHKRSQANHLRVRQGPRGQGRRRALGRSASARRR